MSSQADAQAGLDAVAGRVTAGLLRQSRLMPPGRVAAALAQAARPSEAGLDRYRTLASLAGVMIAAKSSYSAGPGCRWDWPASKSGAEPARDDGSHSAGCGLSGGPGASGCSGEGMSGSGGSGTISG